MAPSTDGSGLDAAAAPEPDPDAGSRAAPHEVDVPPVWAVGSRVVASNEPPAGVVARLSDVPGAGAGADEGEPGLGAVPDGRDADGVETGADGAAAGRGDDPAGASEEGDEGEVAVTTSVREDRAPRDDPPETVLDWQPESEEETAEGTVLDWQPESEQEGVEAAAADWQPEGEPETPLRAEAEAETEAAVEPEPAPAPAGPLGDDYVALLTAAESVLDRVDRALARLGEGTYGTCEACDRPIGDDLLAADPTATTCEQHLRPVDRPM